MKHKHSLLKRSHTIVFWSILLMTHLLACLWLSWHLLSKIDFGYTVGYSLIDSEQHIQEYAPLNFYKSGFAETTPQDHFDLFGEINKAIHHQGAGLKEIMYTRSSGEKIPLLHEAEIIHLQDVANLVDKIYGLGAIALIIFLLLSGYAYWKKRSLPSPRHIVQGGSAGLILALITLLAIGAKNVFYWAHTVVFPDDHQWFFYYQESLMTTLMKAPDIFAFIAVLLILLAIFLWASSFWILRKLLQTRRI